MMGSESAVVVVVVVVAVVVFAVVVDDDVDVVAPRARMHCWRAEQETAIQETARLVSAGLVCGVNGKY